MPYTCSPFDSSVFQLYTPHGWKSVTRQAHSDYLELLAETGAPLEYGKIEETISPAALELIGTWILEHAKSGTGHSRN